MEAGGQVIGYLKNNVMLDKKFLKAVNKYNLFHRKEKVLVGVSGGPDSVALLYLLYQYRKELRIYPHVVHLHHGIRGAAADRDAKYVEQLADKYSFPIAIKRVNVPALAEKGKKNLEEVGREARYDFFAEAGRRMGISKVVTAHTADDQAETYLMRLIRGAGARGLAAMQPVTKLGSMTIVRPLLSAWRFEVEDYCHQHDLKPHIDHTNFLLQYLRNRMRHELLPNLQKINPNVKEVLVQSAELAYEDERYFARIVEQLWERGKALRVEELNKQEFSVLSRLILKGIEVAKGNLREINFGHILAIIEKIEDLEAWELHLPGGLYVLSDGRNLSFTKKQQKVVRQKKFRYEIKVPGVTVVPEVKKRIKTFAVRSGIKFDTSEPSVAYLDRARLGRKLFVRNWREGDTFQPLGMSGSKKLSDFFIDQKVPREERDRVLILTDNKKIVWVAGHRLDERAKVSGNTERILGVKI